MPEPLFPFKEYELIKQLHTGNSLICIEIALKNIILKSERSNREKEESPYDFRVDSKIKPQSFETCY